MKEITGPVVPVDDDDFARSQNPIPETETGLTLRVPAAPTSSSQSNGVHSPKKKFSGGLHQRTSGHVAHQVKWRSIRARDRARGPKGKLGINLAFFNRSKAANHSPAAHVSKQNFSYHVSTIKVKS